MGTEILETAILCQLICSVGMSLDTEIENIIIV